MATPKPVTEPAAPAAGTRVTEPVDTSTVDQNDKVRVYDSLSGEKLNRPVPRSWLDGRFPNLKESPSSKKAGQ